LKPFCEANARNSSIAVKHFPSLAAFIGSRVSRYSLRSIKRIQILGLLTEPGIFSLSILISALPENIAAFLSISRILAASAYDTNGYPSSSTGFFTALLAGSSSGSGTIGFCRSPFSE
jgi:hypothetical protein